MSRSEPLDPREEALIWVLFGGAPDPARPRSLVEAMRRGLVPARYLSEARLIIAQFDYPRRPRRGLAGLRDDEPSWDNVVRAYEDCRE